VGDYSQATTAAEFDFGLELLLEAIGARARPEPVTPPRPPAGRPRSARPGARVG
jgi:hypothetical protein